MSCSLVLFRQDLRMHDHLALHAAAKGGLPVIPVFIWDAQSGSAWSPGAASRWWLHHALERLGQAFQDRGSRLILRRGETEEELSRLVRETGAVEVYWHRRYEPQLALQDRRLEGMLKKQGLGVHAYNGCLLFEPETLLSKSGKPYQVFTPFWNRCLAEPAPERPLSAPRHLEAPAGWPASAALDDLELLPSVKWDDGLREAWLGKTDGKNAANSAVGLCKRFLADAVLDYGAERDRPDHRGTSRLSPYLHFGEISARQVWHAALGEGLFSSRGSRDKARAFGAAGVEQYLRQLGWREFAHHLLHHFPETPTHPLRERFRDFPWRRDARALRAWQQGRTGFPMVDAGMRELWHTGWMHNRVRMITASFLVKDLLIPWQEGARWFWDTLVDADLANNTLGWQWVAGCGADAAPYFRIFNPVSQGERFDPNGDYVRRWVPELASLPDRCIHQPWSAPRGLLDQIGWGCRGGYPRPMVEHDEARERALEAYGAIRV